MTTPDRGEVRFRHLAARDAVTVTIDGVTAIDQVSNVAKTGQAAPIRLAPGAHRIGVLDAAGAVVVAERELNVEAGTVMNLYLTGATAAGVALMQETADAPNLKVVQALPAQVPSGNSGLAAGNARADAGAGRLTARAAVTGGAVAVAAVTGALLLVGYGWRRAPLLSPCPVPANRRRFAERG